MMAKPMSFKSGCWILAGAFFPLLFVPRVADAATSAVAFGVTVVVEDSCLASVNRATLDTYLDRTGNVNPASAVLVVCRNLTQHDVRVSRGFRGPGATGGMLPAAEGLRSHAPVSLAPDRGIGYATAGAGLPGSVSETSTGGESMERQGRAPGEAAETITVTITF